MELLLPLKLYLLETSDHCLQLSLEQDFVEGLIGAAVVGRSVGWSVGRLGIGIFGGR